MVSARVSSRVWSPRLPDPAVFHWTTFTGLRWWFSTFFVEERREIHRYLWSGPPRSEVAAGVWEGLLDVHALARMYAVCLNPRERASFDNAVRWTGGDYPDPPPGDGGNEPGNPPLMDPTDEGYCYEVAFVTSAREKARARLGRNPRGPALAALLLEEPGVWAPGRFQLSFSCEVKTNGNIPFIQAHLTTSDVGCPLSALLPFFSSAVRVGADGDRALLAVPPEPTVSTGRPTMFDLVPRANPETLHIGCYAMMSRAAKTDTLAWAPFTSAASALMLGMYESVRLKSADFVIYVPKGAVNAVYLAVTNGPTSLKGDDWFSAPINDTYQGSDQGAVSYRWSLPENHPFGKEYRSSVLGTGPAKFCFSLATTSVSEIRILGDFVFEVAGQTPLPRFDMMTTGVKGIADAIRATVSSPTRVGVMLPPGGTTEDSSDEDEDEPITRKVSPRSPKAA